jgi:hypothetical protein
MTCQHSALQTLLKPTKNEIVQEFKIKTTYTPFAAVVEAFAVVAQPRLD